MAVCIRDPVTNKRDIWIFDLLRGSKSRLTFDPADDLNPIWSPDGSRIAFTSDRRGQRDLYVTSATSTGEEQLLLQSDVPKHAESWSSDGKFLLYNRQAESVWALPMADPKRKPVPFVVVPPGGGHPDASAIMQQQSAFSPDGRWIAYLSTESGESEVYVQPFPPDGRKWQISTAGGWEPQWRKDGKELFYWGNGAMWSASISAGKGKFGASIPKRLFPITEIGPGRNRWVATARGDRFLVMVPQEAQATSLQVIVNWPALLTKR